MTASPNNFAENLLQWFDQYGRKDLPWQHNKTPYRVWVSEIMLQQTQVNSVIDYFQRFIQRFPDLASLAEANEDEVLEHWAGLGYYARGRNLLKAAKIIRDQHNGEFPDQLEDIIALPGIGRSTAGAILSIAFRKRAAILDGNVKRVLARMQAIDSWPGERQTEQQLWQLAEALTPNERVADYTQAIMDLGATLCTRKKPDCLSCPMHEDCEAFEKELQNKLPVSRPKKTIPQKQTWVVVLQAPSGEILLEKRPGTGIWGGLYSLPEFPAELSAQNVVERCEKQIGSNAKATEQHPPISHTFTHFKLQIHPLELCLTQIPTAVNEARYIWASQSALQQYGMPAPIARFLKQRVHETRALPLDS